MKIHLQSKVFTYLKDVYPDLDCYWDEENGEFTGKTTDFFHTSWRKDLSGGVLYIYPDLRRHSTADAEWHLSDEPYKNKADLAVIISQFFEVPDVLRPYYPGKEPPWTAEEGHEIYF